MLSACTSLPGFVPMVLRGMPTGWRGRHRRIFCWRLCRHAVSAGRKTVAEMARWTPATLTAWRGGRVRTAASWHEPRRVSWWAQDRGATVPAPAHGILALCGDGRHADQRGTQQPVAQQGRSSQPQPWLCGRRFVLRRAAGDGERLPVGCRRMRPKRPAG